MRFIVFGEDWGSHPSSTQHLFKALSKNNKVHWINSVGMRKPSINKTDIKRLIKKAWAIFAGAKKHVTNKPHHNLECVSNLLLLPWHDNKVIRAINKILFSLQVDPHHDDEAIIYWLSVPTAISLITPRAQDKIIYYCGDDFSALAGVDHHMVAPLEQQLVEQADLIYVVSEKLQGKMPSNKTALLTHGVDFELFSEPKPASHLLSNHTAKIGFYGSINEWLDIKLLIALATQRPQYELYLVGALTRYTQDIKTLFSLPNVIHINAVEHCALPRFSQHWQVSLLPFVDNAQIRACNPLKLKEYLASGTPIVSTHFPAVQHYNETLLIACDTEGFISRVDMAICIAQFPSLNFKQSQTQLALTHSWQLKAQQVSDMLASLD
ncbi:glycosyltransferase [Pseudoalteromonas sp. S16_S37]|uniref:glycosyltransferase n=1 Tax=Pseudoalteromonas sp. S16_S37 TaxID=2720228 RepID=UPI00168116AD|nr:glycosyltransferase [Pseudoalteromonas sp. S16_S37]MBD1582148.1 glycosyltransferase family 1 protein [Pseudoalteromonas sp. S16_S37]